LKPPRVQGGFNLKPPHAQGFHLKPTCIQGCFNLKPPRVQGGFNSKPPYIQGGFKQWISTTHGGPGALPAKPRYTAEHFAAAVGGNQ